MEKTGKTVRIKSPIRTALLLPTITKTKVTTTTNSKSSSSTKKTTTTIERQQQHLPHHTLNPQSLYSIYNHNQHQQQHHHIHDVPLQTPPSPSITVGCCVIKRNPPRPPQEIYFESRGKCCKKLLRYNGYPNKVSFCWCENWLNL